MRNLCVSKGCTIQSLHSSTLCKRMEKREYHKLLEFIYILHYFMKYLISKTYTKFFLLY